MAADPKNPEDAEPGDWSIPIGLCQCGCGQATSPASRSVPSRGIKVGDLQPYVVGHTSRCLRPAPDPSHYTVEDRGHDTPCWIWRHRIIRSKNTPNGPGYGWCSRGWTSDGSRLAHRAYYEILVGSIPDGLTIDHLCRQTLCVNPDHLEPVTQRENNVRYYAAVSNA